MFEILDTQIIPVAATAAGFVAGAVAEPKAIERAAEQQQPLVEVWSLRDDEQPESNAQAEPNRFQRIARNARRIGRYVTVLSVSAGIAGGLAAEAWLPLREHGEQQTPPALEVVVDHSAATALAINGKPVIGEINGVVRQLQGIGNVSAEAWVASAGVVRDVNLDKVPANPAFGDAPLEQATQSAIDRAGFAASKRQSGAEHDASVVVLTNDNDIGSVQAVAGEANAKGDTPVFIVNVEGGNSGAAQSLRRIASRTHGKYWDAGQGNLDTVVGDVKKTITADQHEASASPAVTDDTRTMLRLLSLLSLTGVGLAFAQRRKTPFNRNIRGE